MARHLTGPYGNLTATDAEEVIVELDGTVMPNELLLVAVVWEPFTVPGSYFVTLGGTFQRYVAPDNVIRTELDGTVATVGDLPPAGLHEGEQWKVTADGSFWTSYGDDWYDTEGGQDWRDYGYRTVAQQVGFTEYGIMQNDRGIQYPFPGVNGSPVFHWEEWLDSGPFGMGAQMYGLWYPTPFDQFKITFFSGAAPSVRPFPADWVRVLTWKVAEWGGQPILGNPIPPETHSFIGTGVAEGGEWTYNSLYTWPDGPPGSGIVGGSFDSGLGYHAVPQGMPYLIEYPYPEGTELTSDGGDTQRGWPSDWLVNHQIEYGIAARWGQGEGTFTWDDWPGCVHLATVDRAQTYADGHFEFYYRINTEQAPIGRGGTFGPQAHTQILPPDPPSWTTTLDEPPPGRTVSPMPPARPFYRGAGWKDGLLEGAGCPSTGAMLRGSVIGVASVGGGYLPQIYRRVGPAQ